MLTMGLTADEKKQFEAALFISHPIRITVTVLDQDEKPIGSLTGPQSLVISGDIQMDASEKAGKDKLGTKRSLSLVILDSSHKLAIVPSTPADQAVYLNNFISVLYGVWVETLYRWVDVPVFWGPVSVVTRSADDTVTIEAKGKESLVKEPNIMWNTMSFGKGKTVTSTIREVLEAKGETRFGGLYENPNRKLVKTLSLSRTQDAWGPVQKLAETMNQQLFYDGEGNVRLRTIPTASCFTFDYSSGVNGGVTSRPEIVYDLENTKNTVQVQGNKNDQKTHVTATAYAPMGHPLSPSSLSRNGKPRYIVEQINNDHIKRVEQAQALADQRLDDNLLKNMDITFDCLPIPHLEENDLVTLKNSEYHINFRVTQFTLPLTEQDSMSIGYTKPTKGSGGSGGGGGNGDPPESGGRPGGAGVKWKPLNKRQRAKMKRMRQRIKKPKAKK